MPVYGSIIGIFPGIGVGGGVQQDVRGASVPNVEVGLKTQEHPATHWLCSLGLVVVFFLELSYSIFKNENLCLSVLLVAFNI